MPDIDSCSELYIIVELKIMGKRKRKKKCEIEKRLGGFYVPF
jgi:hypothetical protein